MRAALITRLDGPDAVEVVEVDEPSGDDAVLIDVHAAGVAFPDALLTRGLYQYKPDLPFSPGAEVAGVVRSAPAGASVAAGDRVLGLTMLSGGMAEVVALPEDRVFKLPDAVPFDAGAGILFNDMTVHFVLRTRGRLSGGETVLVHGAAGGIGSSVLRLAPALGAARTIAVVSTEEKGEIARAAGASDVVLADGFRDAVKELTDGRGVDMVVDPVGGDRFTDSLRSLAVGGRLLVVGFTGGEIPPGEGEPVAAQQHRGDRRGLGCVDFHAPGLSAGAVGRTGAAAGLRRGRPAAGRGVSVGAGRAGHRVTGESQRQGQGGAQTALSG